MRSKQLVNRPGGSGGDGTAGSGFSTPVAGSVQQHDRLDAYPPDPAKGSGVLCAPVLDVEGRAMGVIEIFGSNYATSSGVVGTAATTAATHCFDSLSEQILTKLATVVGLVLTHRSVVDRERAEVQHLLAVVAEMKTRSTAEFETAKKTMEARRSEENLRADAEASTLAAEISLLKDTNAALRVQIADERTAYGVERSQVAKFEAELQTAMQARMKEVRRRRSSGLWRWSRGGGGHNSCAHVSLTLA